MPNDTVASLIARAATRVPDAPAIVAPDAATLAYRDLAGEVARLAGWLRALGVAPGDRAAWVAPNGPHAALAFLGTTAACASAPPVQVSAHTWSQVDQAIATASREAED